MSSDWGSSRFGLHTLSLSIVFMLSIVTMATFAGDDGTLAERFTPVGKDKQVAPTESYATPLSDEEARRLAERLLNIVPKNPTPPQTIRMPLFTPGLPQGRLAPQLEPGHLENMPQVAAAIQPPAPSWVGLIRAIHQGEWSKASYIAGGLTGNILFYGLLLLLFFSAYGPKRAHKFH